ncbi:MAG: antitoxin [Spirochaetia bacterium]|nr:antitoxin [Spirochaetia bacterium]
MKKNKLDKEEKEILDSFENEEWKSIKDYKKNINKYSEYAKNTLKKDKRINIRINQKDLESIQNIALNEGIPYQTLVSSLIHKFITGKLIERNKI